MCYDRWKMELPEEEPLYDECGACGKDIMVYHPAQGDNPDIEVVEDVWENFRGVQMTDIHYCCSKECAENLKKEFEEENKC